jgi:hypothetical protein
VSVSRKELERLEMRDAAFRKLGSGYFDLADDYDELADDHHKLERSHRILEGDIGCLAGAYLAADEKATKIERMLDRGTISRNLRPEHELQTPDSDEEVAAPRSEPQSAPQPARIKRKRAKSLDGIMAMTTPQPSFDAVDGNDIGKGEKATADAEVGVVEEAEEKPRKKRKTRRRRDRAE